MPPPAKPEQHLPESPFQARLRAEFQAGLASSRDPQNADLPELALRTTTLYSRWFTQICPVCRQTFREGDQVRICPKCGRVYHADAQYHLLCWQQHFANDQPCMVARINPFDNAPIPGCDFRWAGGPAHPGERPGAPHSPVARIAQLTTGFLGGLNQIWKPFGDEQVLEVQPSDTRLIGKECPWCRFQVRAGDRVVKCPCGKCETYFHDDIFRHLTCWNEWNGSRGNNYCPTTGGKIERAPRGFDDSDTLR